MSRFASNLAWFLIFAGLCLIGLGLEYL